MSYDCYLVHPVTGDTLILNRPHGLKGGTHTTEPIREAWFNVTYNYSVHFESALGASLQHLDTMKADKSVEFLQRGISRLNGDPDLDYWAATEGNARKALQGLHALAAAAIAEGNYHYVWNIR